MSTKKFVIFILAIYICASATLINQRQSFNFTTGNMTKDNFYRAFLSPDTEQLMVVNFDRNQSIFYQSVYYFNGTLDCQQQRADASVTLVDWPLYTGGLYAKFSTNQIFKSSTLCGNYDLFQNFSTSQGDLFWDFRNTINSSYVSFLTFKNQTINEYDLVKNTVQRTILFQGQQVPNFLKYSRNGKFLYVQILTKNENEQTVRKVSVVDTESFQKLRQIPNNMPSLVLSRGNNDGKSWIGQDADENLFKVDQQGNTILVYNASENKNSYAAQFCTDDQIFVTIEYPSQNQTILKVFDLNSGRMIQNFTFEFGILKSRFIACNNRFLTVIDTLGMAHVFRVIETSDNQDQGSDLPTWAIIVIGVGVFVIIGVIVSCIIFKNRRKGGDYKRFTNERNQHSIQD